LGIKSLAPKNEMYRQGYYVPLNKDKYVGDLRKIIYRSSYELKFMIFCDKTPSIIKWSSEPIAIRYVSILDMKEHSYYVDFYIERKTDSDEISKKYLIEVKPEKQLYKPILEGKNTTKRVDSYNKSLEMYLRNVSKWKYATKYAKEHGMEFKIVTEKHLF
jgi:hypothetical protein